MNTETKETIAAAAGKALRYRDTSILDQATWGLELPHYVNNALSQLKIEINTIGKNDGRRHENKLHHARIELSSLNRAMDRALNTA